MNPTPPPNNEQLFSAQLQAEMVHRTDKLGKEHVDLALQVKQAREFLDWSAHHMRQLWLDWVAESSKACQDITTFRMAFDRENKAVLATAKDVRDFFLSPEYGQAHTRLKEMLEMMERFQALKKDGTLDAFADFILKVSCGK